MRIKHSIILITYNQEGCVRRALDSILAQRSYIYEVVVSDDCSTDKTWEIIVDHCLRFPELIKSFRNIENLGILGNIESTWSKVTGDVIWHLAGDDEFCVGLFEKADELIVQKSIDLKSEAFTIYFDYKTIDPFGNISVFRNDLVEVFDPVGLKIRELLSNRTTCFSRKVLEKFHPVNKEIGIMADGLYDIQTQVFSDMHYYVKHVGSIYYTAIGIGSRTRQDELLKSKILFLAELSSFISFSGSDIIWLRYFKARLTLENEATFRTFVRCLGLFLNGAARNFGTKFLVRELVRLFWSLFVGIINVSLLRFRRR